MADRIELRGLTAHGYHGVFEQEKLAGQQFIVDVICWLDLSPAAQTDDLSLTINYAELAELAYQVITGPSFDLIEKVAGTIADQIMSRYMQLFAVEVTVHKPRTRRRAFSMARSQPAARPSVCCSTAAITTPPRAATAVAATAAKSPRFAR